MVISTGSPTTDPTIKGLREGQMITFMDDDKKTLGIVDVVSNTIRQVDAKVGDERPPTNCLLVASKVGKEVVVPMSNVRFLSVTHSAPAADKEGPIAGSV